MQARLVRSAQIFLLAGDLFLLNAGFLLAGALRFQEIRLSETDYYDYYIQLGVVVNLLWLLLSVITENYRPGISLEPRRSVSKTLNVFFWHLFLLLLLLVSLKKGEYSRLFLSYFYVFVFLSVLPWHFFYLRVLRSFIRRGKAFRQAIGIGEGSRLAHFAATVAQKPELGLQLTAFFGEGSHSQIKFKPMAELNQFVSEHQIDELYVALPSGDERLQELFYFAERHGLRFRVLPDLGLRQSRPLAIDFYDDQAVLTLRPEPLEQYHWRVLKRSFDILFSLAALLVLFPLVVMPLALAVKLSSRGPAFFKQQRTGYQNKPFKIYKLRSMHLNEEADRLQAGANDARVTRLGAFMRRHHLDEIPQFWNVLLGQMSLVGPRPHMLSHTEKYRKIIRQYMVRHWVRPGLTGLAQVRGLRGAHNNEQMAVRVKTDVYYLENWSFLLDLSILIRTLAVVLFPKK